MKVALFSDTYLPNINGVVTSVELTRKKLEEAGHTVYVFSTTQGLIHIKTEGNLIFLPGIKARHLYGYSIAQPMHPLLLEKVREIQPDIIHCHTEFGVGIFGTYAARSLHVPLVRTYHTTYEDYTHYLNPIDNRRIDNGLKKTISYISRIYGNNCNRLVAPSEKTKKLLESYHIKTPIDVIPTGVEISRFIKPDDSSVSKEEVCKEYRKKADEKIFLYVGRIAKEKSIDMLIRCFSFIRMKNMNLKLIIIGSGPDLESLEQLSRQLNVQDMVLFLGSKKNTDIPVYYHCADCFLSASTSETQGLTYIEALASGLLVFGRDDQAVRDLIEEGSNGYIFRNEDELFMKICQYLKLSKEEESRMKEKAISSAQNYDADLFVERILQTYQKAIDDFYRQSENR